MTYYTPALLSLFLMSSANAESLKGEVANLEAKEHISYNCNMFTPGDMSCTFSSFKVESPVGDEQAKSCTITVSEWVANFKFATDNNWIRNDDTGMFKPLFPEKVKDSCGAINLDRFDFDSEIQRYNFVRRAIPSNPNGTVGTSGATCSTVYSGEETMYQWRERDINAGCDFIVFNRLD